jgi:hypothetical protein
MLFLFNDRVFEIGQPLEIIRSVAFPLSQAAFDKLSEQEMLALVREEIFADPLLVHDVPARAMQMATIVAAKTNANAMLAGPRAGGARTAAEIAVMLAEVSLMTLSSLHIRQVGGTLTTEDVETAVWSALR